jgi:Fanconi anemia group M protein
VRSLSIITDNLLVDSPVAEQLRARGVEISTANLLAGQFQVTDKCAILHVTAEEFARWTIGKDIFRRISELKRSVVEPVLIVEGKVPADSRRPSPAATRGTLAFLALHNRVPVLFTANTQDTVDLIYAMANQAQNGMGEKISPTAGTIPPDAAVADDNGGNGNGDSGDDVAPCERIVRLIPEVGPSTARAMLQRFGNLRELFSASTKDLTKITGLGPRKAKKIATFFDTQCPKNR